MAFNVRFEFVDDHGRKTFRTWVNSNALIADVITQVGVLAPLLNAVIEGGLVKVSMTQTNVADAFAAGATASIDDNASIRVLAGDGFNYDFDLPMINPALVLAGGAINTDDAGIIALFAEFALAKTWHINLRNPTDIVAVMSGTLDK